MRLAAHLRFCVLCTIAAPAAVLAQPPSGSIYICVDASGRRLTADRPIPQCADREQRVLGPSGMERSRIAPALTEAELMQRMEQRRQEQIAQQRLHDQRRREAALLARYPDQAAHDAARSEALAQVDEITASAQRRLQELLQTQQKIEQELQTYPSLAKAPEPLRASLLELGKAQQDQRAVLGVQAEEAQRIHQRFDAELQKLQVLWHSQLQPKTGTEALAR